MLTAHQALAVALLAVALVTVVAGTYAYRRGSTTGAVLRHLLALTQTLFVGQVALGLLLLSAERRTADDLHYLYGFLALGAALSPWLYAPAEPRRRLAWFVGATLLAGALATRAYMTA